jgi:hypothetical protein
MGNVYRFSTRDGKKHVTKNGEEIVSLLGEHGWGWYGNVTRHTAWCVLVMEYGMATADSFTLRFAREYLAEMTCNEFTWTSGVIACMIHEMEAWGGNVN